MASDSQGAARPFSVLFGLADLVVYLWVAANFHRLVLAGERFTFLPAVKWPLVWRYALATVLICGLTAGMGILMLLVLNQFLTPRTISFAGYQMVRLALGFVLSCVALRLLAPLPALAVGQSYGSGFRRLRGTLPTLVLVGLIALAAAILPVFVLGNAAQAIAEAAGEPLARIGPGARQAAATAIGMVGNLFSISLGLAIYRNYQGRSED